MSDIDLPSLLMQRGQLDEDMKTALLADYRLISTVANQVNDECDCSLGRLAELKKMITQLINFFRDDPRVNKKDGILNRKIEELCLLERDLEKREQKLLSKTRLTKH